MIDTVFSTHPNLSTRARICGVVADDLTVDADTVAACRNITPSSPSPDPAH